MMPLFASFMAAVLKGYLIASHSGWHAISNFFNLFLFHFFKLNVLECFSNGLLDSRVEKRRIEMRYVVVLGGWMNLNLMLSNMYYIGRHHAAAQNRIEEKKQNNIEYIKCRGRGWYLLVGLLCGESGCWWHWEQQIYILLFVVVGIFLYQNREQKKTWKK